jgi:predicted nucleic acid-binding protein
LTANPEDMFWDSCVFIRYLTGAPPQYLDDIENFIKDAQARRRTIYFSTLAFTEIRPRFLKQRGYGSIHEFFDDWRSAFIPVDPTPNVYIAAGELRDIDPTNPSDATARLRVLGTADSIHLATCLHVRDTLGVTEVVFHTFDDGKGTNWEGRCVPLLSFERWYPPSTRTKLIEDVCGLPRRIPAYPQMSLTLSGGSGSSSGPGRP